MARISIDRAFEPVEVDLWGVAFKTRPVTRSLQKQVQDKMTAFAGTDDEDAAVKALAEALDVRLEPVTGNGKASDVIWAKWEGDQLTTDQLLGFLDDLAEASRPT